MKRPPKPINELGPDDLPEELPKAVEEAFGKIEIVIENKETSKIFHFLATRTGCKLEFRWNRLIAGVTGIVALIASVRKFWS